MKWIAFTALSATALLCVSTISAEAKHKGGGYHRSHGAQHKPPHLSANGGWHRGPYGGWQRGDVVLGLGGFGGGFGLVTGFGPWGGTYTDPYAWDPYFLDRGYNGFGRPYGNSGG